MRYLHAAEHEALLQAKRELDVLRELLSDSIHAGSIAARARALVDIAADCGMVLTIEQVPLTPLAQGYFQTVVTARESLGAWRDRMVAEEYARQLAGGAA